MQWPQIETSIHKTGNRKCSAENITHSTDGTIFIGILDASKKSYNKKTKHERLLKPYFTLRRVLLEFLKISTVCKQHLQKYICRKILHIQFQAFEEEDKSEKGLNRLQNAQLGYKGFQLSLL